MKARSVDVYETEGGIRVLAIGGGDCFARADLRAESVDRIWDLLEQIANALLTETESGSKPRTRR